jgi:hypothetical protein
LSCDERGPKKAGRSGRLGQLLFDALSVSYLIVMTALIMRLPPLNRLNGGLSFWVSRHDGWIEGRLPCPT